MTREQFERFVDAVENVTRSDLIERAGMWRHDIEDLKAAYKKISEQGPCRESAEVAPEKSAWVSPDPRLLFHLPLDLAAGFVETARHVLSDEKNADRAFGLTRPPGRPVDSKKFKNLALAERAMMAKLQGKTWPEINNEVFADRPDPPDERYIRTLVDRYMPQIMQKWREELRARWLAGSEAREKESIQNNEKKGKTRTANSE
jgi:hypothetical protein